MRCTLTKELNSPGVYLRSVVQPMYFFNYRTAEISKPCELSPVGVTIFEVSGITSNQCTLWLLKQVVLTANCMVIHQVACGELSNSFKEARMSPSCLCNQFIQTASIFYWHTCSKVLHMVITQEVSDASQHIFGLNSQHMYSNWAIRNPIWPDGACHDKINQKLVH